MTKQEKTRVKEFAAKIAQLKTLAERRNALAKVPHYLRHEVEVLLARYFEIRRQGKTKGRQYEK